MISGPSVPWMSWPTVGRDAAVHAVDEMLAGATGGLVVTGGPGVGKTALARAAHARAASADWVSATAATRDVPLGALAHLLPEAPDSAHPLTLTRHAVATLRDRAEDHRLLVVDDAHQLDPLSVAVLHQVATTGAIALVLTVRDRAPAPITALWKDGFATWVPLCDLDRLDVDALLTAVLPGHVDSRTAEELWRLTRGNPRYLRELIEGGQATGRLREGDGFWRWDGPVDPPDRLVEIVRGQLAELSRPDRTALELLTVAGSLPVTDLVLLAGHASVSALERSGVIAVDHAGAPARVAHPLHAEVVRRELPTAESIRLGRRVSRLIGGSADLAERLRGVTLLLDGGTEIAPDLLTDAAEAAATARHLPRQIGGADEFGLDHERALRCWLDGRLSDLQSWSDELHARAMAGPASIRDAHAALHRGWAALAAGRPHTSVRWLTEAAAGLRHADPAALLPLCRIHLAAARALLGQRAAARAELTRATAHDNGREALLGPQADLVQAWLAVTSQDPATPARLALAAAERAARAGQPAVEAASLHDVVRLGAPERVGARLHELSEHLASPMVEAFARHADAAARQRAPALHEVAHWFATTGSALLAAEAAAEAAQAYAQCGRHRDASVAATEANHLAARCEGAVTPALAGLAPPRLTRREDEVARLAVRGVDNQAIARRLVLSVRTVETHLANTYLKLGIRARSQLDDALTRMLPHPRRGD